MARVSIDPVTRIEGHLRVDVQVDGGSVREAWACCTMWRGIERIIVGRDPTEAWFFAQRFCGVCTTVHAMASVRAVEDALKLEIPPNAQFIRNLMQQEPIPGIAYEYALVRRFMPEITLADVNSLARDWVPDRNRVIAVAAPKKDGVPVPTDAVRNVALMVPNATASPASTPTSCRLLPVIVAVVVPSWILSAAVNAPTMVTGRDVMLAVAVGAPVRLTA